MTDDQNDIPQQPYEQAGQGAYSRQPLKQVGSFDRERLEERLMNDYRAFEAERYGGFLVWIKPAAIGIGALAALAVLIYGAYGMFSGGGSKSPPMILADRTPVREKPDNPGGVFVDHEDKSVYEAMRGKSPTALPKVLHILPETEKPANIYDMRAEDRPTEDPNMVEAAAAEVPAATQSAIISSGAEGEDVDKMLEDYIYGTEKDAQDVAEAAKDDGKPMPIVALKPAVPLLSKEPLRDKQEPAFITPEPAPKAPSAEKKVAKNAPSGGHIMKKPIPGNFVQVGAFSDTKDAKRHINKVLQAFPTLVEGKTQYYYQPVDVANKGTLYRLKIGPFNGENSARKACEKLAQRSMDCIYVKH